MPLPRRAQNFKNLPRPRTRDPPPPAARRIAPLAAPVKRLGRGPLVRRQPREGLANGQIGGAALDVYRGKFEGDRPPLGNNFPLYVRRQNPEI